MKNFVIMASVPPYTVKVQFVHEAKNWDEVITRYPDAELVRVIE